MTIYDKLQAQADAIRRNCGQERCNILTDYQRMLANFAKRGMNIPASLDEFYKNNQQRYACNQEQCNAAENLFSFVPEEYYRLYGERVLANIIKDPRNRNKSELDILRTMKSFVDFVGELETTEESTYLINMAAKPSISVKIITATKEERLSDHSSDSKGQNTKVSSPDLSETTGIRDKASGSNKYVSEFMESYLGFQKPTGGRSYTSEREENKTATSALTKDLKNWKAFSLNNNRVTNEMTHEDLANLVSLRDWSAGEIRNPVFADFLSTKDKEGRAQPIMTKESAKKLGGTKIYILNDSGLEGVTTLKKYLSNRDTSLLSPKNDPEISRILWELKKNIIAVRPIDKNGKVMDTKMEILMSKYVSSPNSYALFGEEGRKNIVEEGDEDCELRQETTGNIIKVKSKNYEKRKKELASMGYSLVHKHHSKPSTEPDSDYYLSLVEKIDGEKKEIKMLKSDFDSLSKRKQDSYEVMEWFVSPDTFMSTGFLDSFLAGRKMFGYRKLPKVGLESDREYDDYRRLYMDVYTPIGFERGHRFEGKNRNMSPSERQSQLVMVDRDLLFRGLVQTVANLDKIKGIKPGKTSVQSLIREALKELPKDGDRESTLIRHFGSRSIRDEKYEPYPTGEREYVFRDYQDIQETKGLNQVFQDFSAVSPAFLNKSIRERLQIKKKQLVSNKSPGPNLTSTKLLTSDTNNFIKFLQDKRFAPRPHETSGSEFEKMILLVPSNKLFHKFRGFFEEYFESMIIFLGKTQTPYDEVNQSTLKNGATLKHQYLYPVWARKGVFSTANIISKVTKIRENLFGKNASSALEIEQYFSTLFRIATDSKDIKEYPSIIDFSLLEFKDSDNAQIFKTLHNIFNGTIDIDSQRLHGYELTNKGVATLYPIFAGQLIVKFLSESFFSLGEKEGVDTKLEKELSSLRQTIEDILNS